MCCYVKKAIQLGPRMIQLELLALLFFIVEWSEFSLSPLNMYYVVFSCYLRQNVWLTAAAPTPLCSTEIHGNEGNSICSTSCKVMETSFTCICPLGPSCPRLQSCSKLICSIPDGFPHVAKGFFSMCVCVCGGLAVTFS